MILILTDDGDKHADHVTARLCERGTPFCRFNPAEFPRSAAISISYSPTGIEEQRLIRGDEQIDLRDVRVVWYRRPDSPVPHPEVRDPRAREYVELECAMALQDLWNSLDCAWVPGPPLTVRRAEYKAFQFRIAERVGFELPPTLTTNCPGDLLGFYRKHVGSIVSKQVATAFPATIGFSMMRYTELVTTRDIINYRSIALCPMTFQAYVPKQVELRVTVVGKLVLAAEIHSQANSHTRYDWRRYDLGRTPHLQHELPPEIEKRCVELVEKLGLEYGAIDLILTPDGRYVFLEINPNGQYLWIEHQTGLPISEAVCDLLTDYETAVHDDTGTNRAIGEMA